MFYRRIVLIWQAFFYTVRRMNRRLNAMGRLRERRMRHLRAEDPDLYAIMFDDIYGEKRSWF